jgi:hypothetical protein
LGFLQVQWNTPIYLIDNFASLQRLAMNLYENDNNLIVNQYMQWTAPDIDNHIQAIFNLNISKYAKSITK